jgi:hypothetical protein
MHIEFFGLPASGKTTLKVDLFPDSDVSVKLKFRHIFLGFFNLLFISSIWKLFAISLKCGGYSLWRFFSVCYESIRFRVHIMSGNKTVVDQGLINSSAMLYLSFNYVRTEDKLIFHGLLSKLLDSLVQDSYDSRKNIQLIYVKSLPETSVVRLKNRQSLSTHNRTDFDFLDSSDCLLKFKNLEEYYDRFYFFHKNGFFNIKMVDVHGKSESFN